MKTPQEILNKLKAEILPSDFDDYNNLCLKAIEEAKLEVVINMKEYLENRIKELKEDQEIFYSSVTKYCIIELEKALEHLNKK